MRRIFLLRVNIIQYKNIEDYCCPERKDCYRERCIWQAGGPSHDAEHIMQRDIRDTRKRDGERLGNDACESGDRSHEHRFGNDRQDERIDRQRDERYAAHFVQDERHHDDLRGERGGNQIAEAEAFGNARKILFEDRREIDDAQRREE